MHIHSTFEHTILPKLTIERLLGMHHINVIAPYIQIGSDKAITRVY